MEEPLKHGQVAQLPGIQAAGARCGLTSGLLRYALQPSDDTGNGPWCNIGTGTTTGGRSQHGVTEPVGTLRSGSRLGIGSARSSIGAPVSFGDTGLHL